MTIKILEDIDRIVQSYKRIGISVSGGFDSTLLSYLVHESRKRLGTDNTIEFFTVPRYDDSVVHAVRIVKFIDNTFNNGNPTKHSAVGNPNLHHSKQVGTGLYEMVMCNRIDIALAGENIVPPEEEVPGGPIRMRGTHPKLYKPFFDYTKDVLIQIAIDKKLDKLFEITHTCTESRLLRCNVCWQCRERAWAFNKCNYTDPGTM